MIYRLGLHLAAPFHAKARKWVDGRKNIFTRLEAAIPPGTTTIWMHCASLGEFEQGRPVIERLRLLYPNHKILLTFFSPSGYEIQKKYAGADWVFYLPLDGASTARRFLEIVQPRLVIFVKYEFWYYYLKKINYRNIPLILVSALFRKDMSFFQWYGAIQRKILSRFDQLFVQNQSSKELVEGIGLAKICTVSGDTRFDRVTEIAGKAQPILPIDNFLQDRKAIIAGSTWPADEEALAHAYHTMTDPSLALIIAPHEIDEKHLTDIEQLFPGAIRFSTLNTSGITANTNVLIIDNIGMLSRLYRYASITYVGGGLGNAGIHNVLEAAVYHKPVIFGPNYTKYSEAVELVKAGGGFSFEDSKELTSILQTFLANPLALQKASDVAGKFVASHTGATDKIIAFIQEKRLLTS